MNNTLEVRAEELKKALADSWSDVTLQECKALVICADEHCPGLAQQKAIEDIVEAIHNDDLTINEGNGVEYAYYYEDEHYQEINTVVRVDTLEVLISYEPYKDCRIQLAKLGLQDLTLEGELAEQAEEIIKSGRRAFVFEKFGKLAVVFNSFVAKKEGWEYLGETFNAREVIVK